MSFFTLLFFVVSIVNMCVEADPIAGTAPAPSDQERMDQFMAAVEKAYDDYFVILLEGLDEDNLAYMKTTTMDGVGSFVNYCYIRAKQETSLSSSNLSLEDTNDILMQFNDVNTNSPVAAYKEQCTKS